MDLLEPLNAAFTRDAAFIQLRLLLLLFIIKWLLLSFPDQQSQFKNYRESAHPHIEILLVWRLQPIFSLMSLDHKNELISAVFGGLTVSIQVHIDAPESVLVTFVGRYRHILHGGELNFSHIVRGSFPVFQLKFEHVEREVFGLPKLLHQKSLIVKS